MTTCECKIYQSHQTVTIETEYEGVICSSNETLEENEGEW